MLLTGLPPTSFYGADPDGTRKQVHFDGLPVDFVADAVAAIRGKGQP